MEEVEKFYEWLEKMKSVHLADNYKMNKAYEIVYENSIDLRKPKKFNLNKAPILKAKFNLEKQPKECTQSI
jgi:hypothetical protein